MESFRIKRAEGGKVKGPSHQMGGVSVINKQGRPATEPETGEPYEIEGGERVFSIRDTGELERLSSMIQKKGQGNADDLAATLGYKVAEMIRNQDEVDEEFNAEALDLGAAAGDVSDTEVSEYID